MGILSKLTPHLEEAEIEDNGWDSRWFVNVGSVILGILGL